MKTLGINYIMSYCEVHQDINWANPSKNLLSTDFTLVCLKKGGPKTEEYFYWKYKSWVTGVWSGVCLLTNSNYSSTPLIFDHYQIQFQLFLTNSKYNSNYFWSIPNKIPIPGFQFYTVNIWPLLIPITFDQFQNTIPIPELQLIYEQFQFRNWPRPCLIKSLGQVLYGLFSHKVSC